MGALKGTQGRERKGNETLLDRKETEVKLTAPSGTPQELLSRFPVGARDRIPSDCQAGSASDRVNSLEYDGEFDPMW